MLCIFRVYDKTESLHFIIPFDGSSGVDIKIRQQLNWDTEQINYISVSHFKTFAYTGIVCHPVVNRGCTSCSLENAWMFLCSFCVAVFFSNKKNTVQQILAFILCQFDFDLIYIHYMCEAVLKATKPQFEKKIILWIFN